MWQERWQREVTYKIQAQLEGTESDVPQLRGATIAHSKVAHTVLKTGREKLLHSNREEKIQKWKN